MKHEKLMLARKSRGVTQAQMAQKTAMEQTTYSRKEIGKSSITEDEWDRFANALDVFKEDIKDDKSIIMNNENCTVKDSFLHTQYINLPEKVLDVVMKYNQKLEEDNFLLIQEISQLKQENNQLQEKIKNHKDIY
jgi:transcriptional regulator with XRE-family HTH domain